jgi:hypothetical protein
MTSYFDLSLEEKNAVLEQAAQVLGRPARVLEKDLWVCWVLQCLFQSDLGSPMTFKGGTSLSKVHGPIKRFSEDVDVTVDSRSWGISLGEELSNTRRKKNSELINQELVKFSRDKLLTALACDEVGVKLELEEKPDVKIYVDYPTALPIQSSSYLKEYVLVELGARNPTEPNDNHTVVTDVSVCFPKIQFPEAQVSVLSPIRTFWEKATLIHAKISSGSLEKQAERLCRHWYDLSEMAKHPIWGPSALRKIDMLEIVAKDKERLYPQARADYPNARPGTLRLVPINDALENLTSDFSTMKAVGMFYDKPPELYEILEVLKALESKINAVT